jgi:hypothetical protein
MCGFALPFNFLLGFSCSTKKESASDVAAYRQQISVDHSRTLTGPCSEDWG